MKSLNDITRRDFLKTVGLAAGAGLSVIRCAGPQQTVRVHNEITRALNIIDAHAHPNMFYLSSQWLPLDDASTIEKIKATGLAASSFAAIGDLSYITQERESGPEYQRTKKQLERVQQYSRENKVRVIRKTSDMDNTSDQPYIPGAILCIEGGDALEGKVDRLKEFYDMGVRSITLVHYQNNEIGDTNWTLPPLRPAPSKGGLTKTGSEVIRRMENLGMLIDLAHAHSKTIRGAVQTATKPLINSHTRVCPDKYANICRAACSLDDMELICKTDGVVCTMPILDQPYRTTISDWAAETVELKKRFGIEHLGLGTDGGGVFSRVSGYRDLTDLGSYITALQEAGLTRQDIQAYMHDNVYNLLRSSIG